MRVGENDKKAQGHPPEQSDFKREYRQRIGFDGRNESLFF